jgi:hypothetical protein
MTPRQFRLLLIASIVLGIAGGSVDFICPTLVPAELYDAQDNYDAAMSAWHMWSIRAFVLVGVILLIPSYYGLYRFCPWAPRLAIWMSVIDIILCTLSDVWMQSGIASALSTIASYLWGAVLVLCYVPPLNSQFVRQK